MSGFTSEGTEFESGRCKACGRNGYGMASDGPRCYGCERFVLRDDGANGNTVGLTDTVFEEREFPAPRAYTDLGFFESYMPTTDQMLGLRRRIQDVDLGSTYAGTFSPDWAGLRAVFDSKIMDPPSLSKQQQKKRRPKLKTDEVLAEVDAILREGRDSE